MKVFLTCSGTSRNNAFVSQLYIIEKPGKLEIYTALIDAIHDFAKQHKMVPNDVNTSTVWHEAKSV